MKTIRIGDVQNSLVRLILWQVGKEPITDRHLRAAKDFFGNRCAYCGEEKELHFDHAAPINKTALGQHRVGNLVPSCGHCNQEKGQRDFGEYLGDDPNGDTKIAKILEYMERHNYVPLNDDQKVKELLEEARKEVADVAAKYIAAIDKSLTDGPTVLPPPTPELPAVSTFPAHPAVVSNGSNGVSGSPHTELHLGKVSEIKKTMNRSWINLRRGCLDQMGVSVSHGTPKVRASSRAFAKKTHEATGLRYAEIVALLNQHRLGLEG